MKSNLNIIKETFSKTIFLKATLLKEVNLSKREISRIKESITDEIRKYTDLINPLVSRMALARAKEKGIELEKIGWHDQTKYDKKREVFHLEHFYTVKSIRDLCINANTTQEVDIILTKNAKTIWILKEEDNRLTKLGYRSERDDPYKAYEEAGIEIIE